MGGCSPSVAAEYQIYQAEPYHNSSRPHLSSARIFWTLDLPQALDECPPCKMPLSTGGHLTRRSEARLHQQGAARQPQGRGERRMVGGSREGVGRRTYIRLPHVCKLLLAVLATASASYAGVATEGTVTGGWGELVRGAVGGRLHYRRQAAEGDGPAKLGQLNALLEQLVVTIGALDRIHVKPSKYVPSDIDLDVSALKCQGFQLGELQIDAQKKSEQDIEVMVSISRLEIRCACDWKFHYAVGGRGSASVWSSGEMGNSLSMTIHLRSEDLATLLPAIPEDSANSCTLKYGGYDGTNSDGSKNWIGMGDGWYVHLDPLKGSDIVGILGKTVAERFRKDMVAGITNGLKRNVCTSIGQFLPSLLKGVFSTLNNVTAPLVQDIGMPPVSRAAKLSPERLLNRMWAPNQLQGLGDNWLVSLAKLGADKLAEPIDATTSPPSCYDDARGVRRCSGLLFINSLVESALGKNGTLLLLAGELGEIAGCNTRFSVTSDIIDIEVDLVSVQIRGLNSFSSFDALTMIGNETTQWKLALQYIGLDVRLHISMRATSNLAAENLYLACPQCSQVPCLQCQEGCSPEPCGNTSTRNSCPSGNQGQHPTSCTHSQINEQVKLNTGIERPKLELAAMLGIVSRILDDMPLGDVTDAPLPCLLSVLATRDMAPPSTCGVNLSYLNATVANIYDPALEGFIDGGTDEVIESLISAMFLAYKEAVINGLPSYAHRTLRPMINEQIEGYLSETKHVECPSVSNASQNNAPSRRFVDFRDANLSSILPSWAVQPGRCEPPCTVAWIVNTAIGVDKVNDLIGLATKASSGREGEFAMAPEADLFGFDFTMKPDVVHMPATCITCWRIGHVSFSASNLSISGLNTVSVMELLEPDSKNPYVLSNMLQMKGAPLEIKLDVAFSIKGKVDHEVRQGFSDPEASPDKLMHLYDRFTIKLTLEQVQIVLDILLMIDRAQFWQMKVGLLTDVRQYLSTLAALRPEQLKVESRSTSLSIECHRCSSPLLFSLSSNLNSATATTQLSARFNQFWSTFAKHFVDDAAVQSQYERQLDEYYAGDLVEDIKEFCNDGPVAQTTAQCDMWKDLLQCQTNRHWMRERCPVSCGMCPTPAPEPEPEPDVDEGLSAFEVVLVIFGVLLSSVLLALCCRSLMCRRGGKFGGASKMVIIEPITRSKVPSIRGIHSNFYEDSSGSETKGPNGSLMGSPHLHAWLRYGVPFTLCVNIALFVSGHVEIGSTVDLSVSVMGEHVRSDRFVEFSLGHSLIDLWHAESYLLFYMVGGFSGLWPYGKLLLLLFCWLAPSSCLSPARRESWLMKCEAAGTWSFMDMYLLVMCLLGFSIHVTSPDTMPGVLPKDFYALEGILTPVWGLYGFVLGIILSIAVNYVMLQAHRQAVHREAGPRKQASAIPGLSKALLARSPTYEPSLDLEDMREALFEHDFDDDSSGGKYGCTSLGRWVVLGLLTAAGVLIFVGGFLPSFEFRTFGIAGALVDFGRDGAADTRYSLVSSTGAVIRQAPARYGGWLGLVFIAVVYFGFAWVVPLAVVGLALAQWWIPLTLRRQRQLESLAEALRAWSALFVFSVSIAIAMEQIEQVSSFFVGNPCKRLDRYFQDLAAYGLLEKKFFPPEMQHNKYCFVVKASNLYGLFVLLIGGCISKFACKLVSSLTLTAIAEREKRSSAQAQATFAARNSIVLTRKLPGTTMTVAGQVVYRTVAASSYTCMWQAVAKASGCISERTSRLESWPSQDLQATFQMDGTSLPQQAQLYDPAPPGDGGLLATDSAEFQALNVVEQLERISSHDGPQTPPPRETSQPSPAVAHAADVEEVEDGGDWGEVAVAPAGRGAELEPVVSLGKTDK